MDIEQRYRERALECSVAAELANDHAERLKLHRIAQLYLKLAKYVARIREGKTNTYCRHHGPAVAQNADRVIDGQRAVAAAQTQPPGVSGGFN